MQDYILSCESTCDLTKEQVEASGLFYRNYTYSLGNDFYPDDFYQTVSDTEFYQRMLKGEIAQTSALNPTEYKEYLESFLKDGKDILHVTVSSALTSTVQNIKAAASELAEEYPDRKIYVVDSLGASGGYGLLMLELAERKNNGMDIDTLKKEAEELRSHIAHLFFSTDLRFYIRGGRISKAAGTFAKALSICPLCDMDREGYLVVREKIRTKLKVKERMVEKFIELAKGHENYNGRVLLTHSMCREDAEDVIHMIEEKMPHLKGTIKLNPLGPTIGSHTGPYTVALFFISEDLKPARIEGK